MRCRTVLCELAQAYRLLSTWYILGSDKAAAEDDKGLGGGFGGLSGVVDARNARLLQSMLLETALRMSVYV